MAALVKYHIILDIIRYMVYTKYSSVMFLLMDPELQDFAEYLGLKGIDSDLFYESYYRLDSESYDETYDIMDAYDDYSA